jgi:hypothetical protein
LNVCHQTFKSSGVSLTSALDSDLRVDIFLEHI